MSRRTLLVIIALLLLLLGVWFYFSLQSKSSTPGSPTTSIGSLFPFGPSKTTTPASTGSTNVGTGNTNTEPSNTDQAKPAPRLIQLSTKLTAGLIVLPPVVTKPVATVDINDPTGAQKFAPAPLPVIRFAEKGTGYIYDINANKEGLIKQSGTIIAHTVEAVFGNNGAAVVLRYAGSDNQTISSFLGQITPAIDATTSGTTRGDFLPDNISEIVPSFDSKNFFFLLPTTSGVAGMTMKADGSSKAQLFSSPFSEWLLDWSSTNPIVTTKASANVAGNAYFVLKNGVFSKIVGDVNGLTTKISPDGKNVLYSVSKNNSLVLYVKHLSDGLEFNTGLSTLPEKCVWNSTSTAIYCGSSTDVPSGTYPDDWYQGLAHFNDSLWKINPQSGRTTLLDDGEGNNLDVTNLAIDQKEGYLFFTNKNDDSLWSFNLTPPNDTSRQASPSPTIN
ncbi:MAG: hypothetical protein WCG55_02380 [bacterium]